MSGAKRWDHVTNWGDHLQITSTMMGLSDTGKYVLASDYDRDTHSLRVELANAKDYRNQQYDMKVKAREQRDTLRTANQRLEGEVVELRKAFRAMRNVAAGYSNYCEESASTRRLEREFETADELYRAVDAGLAIAGGE